MIPPRKHLPEESVDSWLMSYADMITLLMCFFIIFVSVSEPKKDKFSIITDGLASQFGSVDMSTPFHGVFAALQTVVETNKVFKDMAVEQSENGIRMELSSAAFFNPASADFAEDKLPLLVETVAALKSVDFLKYRIAVESHTNDVPINTALFPTNWELSTSRASRVVRYFIEQGISADSLSAVGYADTQPKVPNADAAGKPIAENREKNQRIVITLERAR